MNATDHRCACRRAGRCLVTFLDPNDPRTARVYLLADARACRKVADDLRAKRCWHAIGTPGRRALEHNIEANELMADRIERQFPHREG